MSQRQLAAELGVTATTIARWERGERAISTPALVRLALDHIEAGVASVKPAPLPVPPTGLIGRDRELAGLAGLLADPVTRLVTLTGPGGAGKTVLALAAVNAAAGTRAGGAFLIELDQIPAGSPAATAAAAFAAALGVRETSGEPLARTVTQALRRSDALLLVDNCEHVAAAAGALLSELAQRCPAITVLATSREPLRIRAERRFPVPPLRVPDLARLPPPAALARVPAVSLFVARWSAANPGFRLTAGHARAVAEICVNLDGLPLAIELAAAYGRPPSPAALLARLGSFKDQGARDSGTPDPAGHGLSVPGLRDLPDRQRSLRAVLDWSYDLLDPRQQAIFRRLSVFTGGFGQHAAAQVVVADTGELADLAPALDALIEANLVLCRQGGGDGRQLRLLQTVRGYARERLTEAGELDATAARHAMWLIGWTEAGAGNFESSAQLTWLDTLDAEIANVRAALAWSRSSDGDAGLGLRLAAAVRRYWDMRGLPTEAEEHLTALLGAVPAAASPERLGALIELGGLAISREDPAVIERNASQAALIATELGDLRGAANAAEQMTYVAFLRGDLALAQSMASQSLDQAIRSAHPPAVARARMACGVAAYARGDLNSAAAELELAIEHARANGDHWFVGECASVLTHVHFARGGYQAARAAEQESLAARVALKNRPAMAVNLKLIGIADAGTGHIARTAVLFGGAAGIEETTSATWQGHWIQAYRDAEGSTRGTLGDTRFHELWEFGRMCAEPELVKIALRAPTASLLPSPAHSSPTRRDGSLTPRETQVSELITAGLSSPEIARRLGITRRTADAHVEHIITKLGVHSRAQIAVWVTRHRS